MQYDYYPQHQPPVQSPIHPPARVSFWQRKVGCIPIWALLGLGLLLCGIVGSTGWHSFGSMTTTPTPSPQDTQRKGIIPTYGTPRLGAPISDFLAVYGKPNSNSTPGAQYFFSVGNNVNQVVAHLTTGSTNVDGVEVSAPHEGSWTPAMVRARCLAFAPSDAHQKQTSILTDGTGYNVVYFSAELSPRFAASWFYDSQSNPVQPGTFDITYTYARPGDPSHLASCFLAIGATGMSV